MSTESGSLASVARILWRLLQLHRVDPLPYFAAHGISPATLYQPGARVPARSFDALVVTLSSRLRDPAAFLQTANLIHPSSLGVVGYAWLSSSTLRIGFKLLIRYWRLMANAGTSPHLTDSGSEVQLSFHHITRRPAAEPLVVDFVLSGFVALARMNAGDRFSPLRVELRRPAPADQGPYADFFRCPVVFGASQNCLVMSASELDAPLHSADPTLAWKFDDLLLQQMTELHAGDFGAQLHWAVARELPFGPPTQRRIAEVLLISPRALSQKLRESGLSIFVLTDDVRRQLALLHLEDPARALPDIAFALGFGQQGSFTSAFRRWTGKTPAEYRAGLNPPFTPLVLPPLPAQPQAA